MSSRRHIDERFMEGRCRHILEGKVAEAQGTKSEDLRCRAGFIGVRWVSWSTSSRSCSSPSSFSCPKRGVWKRIELPGGADDPYVCIKVKASNYFMPNEAFAQESGQKWLAHRVQISSVRVYRRMRCVGFAMGQ